MNGVLLTFIIWILTASSGIYSGTKLHQYYKKNNFSVKNETTRLDVHSDLGSVSLYAVDKSGNSVSLLNNKKKSQSSYFILYIDDVPYKLQKSELVSCGGVALKNGAAVSYLVSDKALVCANYSFLPDYSAVSVSFYITNLCSKEKKFRLVSVYDTILGESEDNEFCINDSSKINIIDNKSCFENINSGMYIRSFNKKAAVQFMPDNENPFNLVVFADRKDFSSELLISKTDYNYIKLHEDSAVLIKWNEKAIGSMDTKSVNFYVSFATDGENPILLKSKTVEESDSSSMQLDYSYVQSLIEKIESLKADDSLLDEAELVKLNAELDTILEKLGQK